MFPFQSRRAFGHSLALRSDKPKKSGNKKACDIFYDPDGVFASPGPEGNVPDDHADLDVPMDDWESNKEQIDPEPTAREEIQRVYLNPWRPLAEKSARALQELSVEALYPELATDHLTGKSGAPNMKGAVAGISPTAKTFTPAITTSNTNSGGGTFRVPAIPVKDLHKADTAAGASIDLEKKDILSNPLPTSETVTISEANGKSSEPIQDDDEENKENQPPPTFLRGVDPNNDKGFADESPFGSDLAHLLIPYAQEPILANDPSSKLRAPISISKAMAISKGSEPGSVPIIREGSLGELSAEHLYLTGPEARELVYIPSQGLPYRYDSLENFVPTLTMASALKDIREALSNFEAFEIWKDGDETSGEAREDKAIARTIYGIEDRETEEEDDSDGDSENELALNEDQYEQLLQLHFGDGFSENIDENPSQGTILVRSQAPASASIIYNDVTESRRLVEDNGGSYSPPSKLRILHRSPGTDRDEFEDMLALKTGGNVEAVVRSGTVTGDDDNENTPPRTDVDPFVAVNSDETVTPPDSVSTFLRDENHSPALLEKPSEIHPQKLMPSIIGMPPIAFPHSPSVATPALSPLTVHSPPNLTILNATASTITANTDTPSMPIFPASLTRSNSFREFRDPLSSAPVQVPQPNRRHPVYQNDMDDEDRFGSLQSASPRGTHAVKLDGTGAHDNEEKLSQLNLI